MASASLIGFVIIGFFVLLTVYFVSHAKDRQSGIKNGQILTLKQQEREVQHLIINLAGHLVTGDLHEFLIAHLLWTQQRILQLSPGDVKTTARLKHSQSYLEQQRPYPELPITSPESLDNTKGSVAQLQHLIQTMQAQGNISADKAASLLQSSSGMVHQANVELFIHIAEQSLAEGNLSLGIHRYKQALTYNKNLGALADEAQVSSLEIKIAELTEQEQTQQQEMAQKQEQNPAPDQNYSSDDDHEQQQRW